MLTKTLHTLLGLAIGLTASAAELQLPRHPAPTPDGSEIVFGWQNDLWIVDSGGGQARRLTANLARDHSPVISPDGSWIAFASDRSGTNDDVWALPVDGSEAPRRLTWYSVGDIPTGFRADGKSVIFTSSRRDTFARMPSLYQVSLDGGTPGSLGLLGRAGAFSPQGESLAFVRGITPRNRHAYRGAANRDLWLKKPSGELSQLTEFDGDDDYPSWLDEEHLVYSSAAAGRKNLFVLDLSSGERRQLTAFEDSGIRAPKAAADGSLVAWEHGDAIYTIDPGDAEAEPRRVSITVPAEELRPRVERKTSSNDADELDLDNEGKHAVISVDGELFVVELLGEEDQELATPRTVALAHSPFRERSASFSPDGTSIVFSSDRSGSNGIYLAKPKDPEIGWTEGFEFAVETLADSSADEHSPVFSPDGSQVAFIRARGDLLVVEIASGESRVLFEHWADPSFSWSPDGRWISWSAPDLEFNDEVFLADLESWTVTNVSRHPDADLAPFFTPDGRRLLWSSRRHADTFDIWGLWLTRAADERNADEWYRFFQAQKEDSSEDSEDDDEADEDGEDGEEPVELPETVIEIADIALRAQAITSMEGDEYALFADENGQRIYFTADPDGDRDLYSIRWDGEELERLGEDGTSPESVQMSTDFETIAYLDSSGTIKRMGADGKSGDPAPFSARWSVDRQARLAAVFDEAWRELGENFYDPGFHGADWPALRERYRPWALGASSQQDFTYILNLMIGELNASHLGYYPRGDTSGDRTGELGLRFSPESAGPGLEISEVLWRSPADRHDISLQAGDRLLGIAGQSIQADTNVWSLLVDTAGQRLPIEVQREDGRREHLVIKPTSAGSYRQLRYDHWARERAQIVENLSYGRLGYLHIQGMSMPSFEDFERRLSLAGADKEGLVIDVRFNGGGWTTDYLMAVLMVQRHAWTVPRGADGTTKAYPQSRLPLAAWTRPAITLCNEASYSNAEIFAHAFKSLERGTVVGQPTFGAVISTGGVTLADGNWLRLPFRGWYVAGSDANMELGGMVPDVLVPQPPADDFSAEQDSQLAETVRVLLEEIDSNPDAEVW